MCVFLKKYISFHCFFGDAIWTKSFFLFLFLFVVLKKVQIIKRNEKYLKFLIWFLWNRLKEMTIISINYRIIIIFVPSKQLSTTFDRFDCLNTQKNKKLKIEIEIKDLSYRAMRRVKRMLPVDIAAWQAETSSRSIVQIIRVGKKNKINWKIEKWNLRISWVLRVVVRLLFFFQLLLSFLSKLF